MSPQLKKEGCASSDESHVSGCSSFLIFFYTVCGDVSQCFEATGENDVCNVRVYVWVYIHVLRWTCIIYMSVHPSGKESNFQALNSAA